jgi:hypothetical protein
MALADRIHQRVQELPASSQTEVLDFVEYLLAKASRQEDDDWTNLSLASAIRGMENEEMPTYTPSDLKETFA